MALDLRDYYYLDTVKLEHYTSSLDRGSLQRIREVMTEVKPAVPAFAGEGDFDGGDGVDRTLRRDFEVSNFNAFSQLYSALKEDLLVFDEDKPIANLAEVRKNQMIEVSRDFSKSPVNDMLDQVFQLADMMQRMPDQEKSIDPEAAKGISAMALFFRGGEEQAKSVPIIARSEEENEASIVFVVQLRHLVQADPDSLEGERTVLGKVSKIIRPGASLNLLEQLTSVPRALRRSKGGGAGIQASITQLFSNWPDDLGGGVSPDQLEVPGPVLIIDPLAVYT